MGARSELAPARSGSATMGSWVDPHSSAARSSCGACPASSTRRSRGSAGSCSSQVSPASARPGWRSRFSIRPAEGEPGPPSARAGMAPERQACGRGCRSCGRSGWRLVTNAGWRPGPPGHDALTRLLDSDEGDPPAEFHLFEATLQLLTSVCDDRPLVVLLDDLQWADSASLSLMDFLHRHAVHLPMLVVGTYRADELGRPDHPHFSRLADLAQKALTVPLTGLDNDGIRQLRADLGVPTTTAEAEHLRRLTAATRSSSSSPSRSATRRSRSAYAERSTAASTPSATPNDGSSSWLHSSVGRRPTRSWPPSSATARRWTPRSGGSSGRG